MSRSIRVCLNIELVFFFYRYCPIGSYILIKEKLLDCTLVTWTGVYQLVYVGKKSLKMFVCGVYNDKKYITTKSHHKNIPLAAMSLHNYDLRE